MNPIIKQQLSKISAIDIEDVPEDVKVIEIPKRTNLADTIQIGDCFYVELEDYLLQNSDTYTLHANWNGGKIPKSKQYFCEIKKIMGKMIYISGTFDSDSWEGWLPKKSVKFIRRI